MKRAFVRALPWLGLFVAALAVRSLGFGRVFVDAEVRFPFGVDELYHMRRIWFTVVNFPATLDFDRYMNFPEGAPPIWSPFFDWTIAALARALVGAGDQHAVEVVAAWVPPVLGALAVMMVMAPVRVAYSTGAGWLTGWLLLTPPAHVLLSELGQVDHHVAVGLFAAVLVTAALWMTGPGVRPRVAVATGVVAAAAILLWAGALLQVLVVQAFLTVQLLATREAGVARARASSLVWMHVAAAVVLAPYGLGRSWAQFGAFSPEVHSNFQPLWFGAGAAALAATRWLWATPSFGGDRPRRVATALAVALPGVGAAWWLLPGLGASLESASGWFADDAFLGRIQELKPLLFAGDRFAPALAHDRFSYLFWATPVLLAALAWQAVRARRADRLLLAVFSAVFLVAALFQQRFVDVAAASYAWALGPALAEGLAWARRRGAPRWGIGVAALGVAIAALLPAAFRYGSDLEASLRGAAGSAHPIARRQRLVRQAAEWMKRETPETLGYLDASLEPGYGVLTSWDSGHLVRYYAERPVVQDNFGPWGGRAGFEAARRYFEAHDEAEALAIAERLGIRYVVALPKGSGQLKPSLASMTRRLLVLREPGGALAFNGEGLGRHRLVHLADDVDPERPGEPPRRVAVYEIVAGARVVGTAPAGETIRFELRLRLPDRGAVFYSASARADASGRYALRLPYPSEAGYTLRMGSARRSLPVAEADVREGRTLEGPRFGP